MTSPDWREVKLSPRVLDRLRLANQAAGFPSTDEEIARHTIGHVIEGFREEWDTLPSSPDGVRRLDFYGDYYPALIFYGVLESTRIYHLSLVEETVKIIDVRIVDTPRKPEDFDE